MATLLKKSNNVVRAISHREMVLYLQQRRSRRLWLAPLSWKVPVQVDEPSQVAKSWSQRVKEIEGLKKLEASKVNIGFAASPLKVVDNAAFRKLRQGKDLVELERKSRKRELKVPIDEHTVESFKTDKQRVVKNVADYYGIYRDLYNHAYFYPQLPLDVSYEVSGEQGVVNPVFYGNVLPPSEVKTKPTVQYPCEADKLYTLCMTAPDSHLQEKNKEYLHWLVGNIPGNKLQDGECLCDYLEPFPVLGTGLHRYVFILYQQDRSIDFSEEKRPENCASLKQRTFETFEFLRKYQDAMTPVGLAFFQSEYDESVRSTFHDVLKMDEPRYEFYPPLPYVPKQLKYPIREPFNVYLDRYRDVKDINEEVLLEKLKTAEPFKPRDPPKKYPNIYKFSQDVPSWLKLRLQDKRLRKSYWRGLDD